MPNWIKDIYLFILRNKVSVENIHINVKFGAEPGAWFSSPAGRLGGHNGRYSLKEYFDKLQENND